jgi:hypothetical protein
MTLVISLISTFLILTVPIYSFARGNSETQSMAISQGISSPDIASSANWKSGFTHQNSAVAGMYNSAQIVGQYDTNEDDDSNGYGAELSLGNGTVGIGVGVYTRDCDNCDESTAVLLGYDAGSWGVGVGLREDDQYSVGLLFELSGSHHLGITFDTLDSDVSTEDVDSYGLGYSYKGSGFVFSLDASKRADEVTATNDDVIQVSPGVMVEAGSFALGVTYDAYTDDDGDVYEDEAWVALGYTANSWTLNLYKDFIGDWALNYIYRF